MQRTRTLAGSPFRSASETWSTVVALIEATLERSSEVPPGSVRTELAPLSGLGAAMVASNLFDAHPLVLTAGDLDLTIIIKSNDDAFAVDENLDPVPGGASAPASWKLYLPEQGSTSSAVEEAAQGSSHIFAGKPQRTALAASASSPGASVDMDALRRMGGR